MNSEHSHTSYAVISPWAYLCSFVLCIAAIICRKWLNEQSEKYSPHNNNTVASANTTFYVKYRGWWFLVVCDESPGLVSYFLTICSLLLVLVTLPFSLLYTVKVVQVNYELPLILSGSWNLLSAYYGCWSETKIKSQYPGLIIQRLNWLRPFQLAHCSCLDTRESNRLI